MARKLKIYGTRRRGHRERHYIKAEGKYRYYEVRRDVKGHFRYKKKWTPKKPIGKPEYREDYIEAETGKQAYLKVIEHHRKYEWVDFEVES